MDLTKKERIKAAFDGEFFRKNGQEVVNLLANYLNETGKTEKKEMFCDKAPADIERIYDADFKIPEDKAFSDVFDFKYRHTHTSRLEIVELLLKLAEQYGQHANKDKVECARVEQRPDHRLRCQLIRLHDDLGNENGIRQCRILDQRDDLVGHRWHDTLDHL